MKARDISKSESNVPFFVPWITKEDKKAITDALNSHLLTDGPKLRQFESAFAKLTGAKYAIGVSNATAALHLSIKALGIGKGDEVIVPDMTFVATANAVVLSGAVPVFADVEKETMNISIDSIKKKINPRTKAILPVHFAGKVCDIVTISRIARENNVAVIEDCAHAIGAQYDGKHVGNFGSTGCFSFYPTKNITTIEGGMIITNSKKIAEYVMSARNHGLTKTLVQRYASGKPWDYDMIESGYNYRLDEIRSALGLSQIKRIKKLNALRKKVFEYYNKRLKHVSGLITPHSSASNDHAYHLYIMRVERNGNISRDKLFSQLLQYGIKTTVHYKPLHEFTAFNKFKSSKDEMKNSKQLYEEIISLPFYPNMPKKQQDFVIDCIIKIMNS
ncbi:DegT/DnrJ/EryC1/StrS family aminotransferase [Candidatus Nitrosotenuis chungbukensis]|uniref:DegT/DnrJ/EryC1/StrS family aminotransferase n=2 Tax=Candidatus Nitrosotenuis chungbukensis TaxID=1353246 RepID=UPI000693F92B|nr:DegT/DnrJ/EryC1/StrS family aminotransferase [Candidatus Nitrosotenuis chungbukensis]